MLLFFWGEGVIYRVAAERLEPLNACAADGQLDGLDEHQNDFAVTDDNNFLKDISHFFDKLSTELVSIYKQYKAAASGKNIANRFAAYFKLASIMLITQNRLPIFPVTRRITISM